MAGESFAYTNVSDRPPGRVVAVLGRFLPGVAEVQRHVGPFARAWEDDNRLAALADGALWVALGDSLTLGIGASAHDRGWVGLLRDRLHDAGRAVRVVNLAVSGATTADVLDRQLPVALDMRPDLVTVMIGSNDLMSPRRRRGLATRYAQILRQLPDGAVVATLPNPARPASAVNGEIERAAAAGRVLVGELRDPRHRSWRGKLAADHFHPNDRGYAMLADAMARPVLTRLSAPS